MARAEKSRHRYFYILNVKLRKKNSTRDQAAEDYVRIFKKVSADKIHKESSPGKHCIFRFMFDDDDEHGNIKYLSGTIAQFTYIQNDRWFNLNSLDFDAEFRVPEGLFPDTVTSEFVFVPKAHRFTFRTAAEVRMSPYPIKKFLESALNDACNSDEIVQVDVESDTASLKAILEATEVRKLSIDVNYSNVDIGGDLKAFFENDIKASNSERVKIEATQKPDVSIDIPQSKILTGALEAAISNGEAEATIVDENNRVKKIKTSAFPRKESVFSTMTRFSETVYEKIMHIFRPNAN